LVRTVPSVDTKAEAGSSESGEYVGESSTSTLVLSGAMVTAETLVVEDDTVVEVVGDDEVEVELLVVEAAEG